MILFATSYFEINCVIVHYRILHTIYTEMIEPLSTPPIL